MTGVVETYRSRQHFNSINRFLHGRRFRRIVAEAQRIAEPGKALRVLEIGCAYGEAYAALDAALAIEYLGVDLEKGFIEEAERLYGHRSNFRAEHGRAKPFVTDTAPRSGPFDLVFALETLEHIPAPEVVDILEAVARMKPRLFCASVPVEIGPSILVKNWGSALMGYMRHKDYSIADTIWSALYRIDKVPPHACGHRGFDWRWLLYSIHNTLGVSRVESLPFAMLPRALATNVFIVSERPGSR